MKKRDVAEAAAYLRQVLSAVLTSAVGATTADGADLFRQVGALSASAEAAISTCQLGTPLLGCFDAAYTAGATLTTLAQLRGIITVPTFSGQPAIIVQQSCLRMALVEEAKIIAGTALVSRQDVDTLFARVNEAFDPAETFAADAHDSDAYRAIIALHAAVAQDLATRGRPLPRIVPYSFPRRLPALTLSQRLYSDGSRSSELIEESQVFHPAFMPQAGKALSA